jgi:hypothetical protein
VSAIGRELEEAALKQDTALVQELVTRLNQSIEKQT